MPCFVDLEFGWCVVILNIVVSLWKVGWFALLTLRFVFIAYSLDGLFPICCFVCFACCFVFGF